MNVIEEKEYYIYISKNVDSVLLSISDKGKGFVYLSHIYFFAGKHLLNTDSLLIMLKKLLVNTILINSPSDYDNFEIKEKVFSDTCIYSENYDTVYIPKTYAYLNIFKYTKIKPAYESILNHDFFGLAKPYQNKSISVATDSNENIIAFTNSIEANEFKEARKMEDFQLIKIKIRESLKYSSINFINDDILLLKKGH